MFEHFGGLFLEVFAGLDDFFSVDGVAGVFIDDLAGAGVVVDNGVVGGLVGLPGDWEFGGVAFVC